jgi:hypothetical protein
MYQWKEIPITSTVVDSKTNQTTTTTTYKYEKVWSSSYLEVKENNAYRNPPIPRYIKYYQT